MKLAILQTPKKKPKAYFQRKPEKIISDLMKKVKVNQRIYPECLIGLFFQNCKIYG